MSMPCKITVCDNDARYTSGRCGLCDLALPEEERGILLGRGLFEVEKQVYAHTKYGKFATTPGLEYCEHGVIANKECFVCKDIRRFMRLTPCNSCGHEKGGHIPCCIHCLCKGWTLK